MADGPGDGPPLDLDEIEACFAPLLSRPATGLMLAVSGGIDSICLMQGVALLARRRALPPVAIATVDHGLRPGSADDARFVLAEAAALGLPAHALAWTGPKPAAALQEKARAVRYALLAGLCADLGYDHLLTAHTIDDQAETVLFRLARGSGPAGLAGMRAFSSLGRGVTQARPLLGLPKARLLATCRVRGWAVRHDPSNDDPRFARTRLRRLLPALAAEGLDAHAFARLAARLDRTEAALDHAAAMIGRDVARCAAPEGWELDLRALAALPDAFTTRLIGRAIAALSPGTPLRLDRLEQAAEAFRTAASGGAPLVRTLRACVLRLARDGLLRITLEPHRRRGGAPPARTSPSRPVKAASDPSLGKGERDPYIAG